MKRKQLLDNLNIAKTCLATDDTIPALTHFYFDQNTIVSWNTKLATIIKFETGLSCCIPGNQLIKMIGSYSTEEMSIKQSNSKDETKSTVSINIKSGKSSNLTLNQLPVSSFPFTVEDADKIMTETAYQLTPEFFEGIKQCAISMSTNPGNKDKFGITIFHSPEKTVLYSTDKVRISAFTLSKPLDCPPFKVLLPRGLCEALVTISSTFKSGNLHVGESALLIDFLVEGKSAGVQLYSKFSNKINLLPFENILKQVLVDEKLFQKIPDTLLGCVDRNVILTSSDKNPAINIKSSGNVLEVSSSNDHGTVVDEVEFPEQLVFVDCRIRSAFLRDAIAYTDKIAFSTFNGDPILLGMKDKFLHTVSSVEE
jgi:DNA polymerase III sliding clamp (beta) subunit (PCNA family)